MDLSPNGKFLAAGETGYNPRVNIFSTVPGASPETPLTILTEHSYGVRCVAFSPDSRWLATLGDANDGFLFIWSVNQKTGAAKLHFTNRCTATVLDIKWCKNNLITVGTRYVKVWRVGEHPAVAHTKQGRSFLDGDGMASPAPKTLVGRNCILGSLADFTFTCVAPISDCEAILCTTTGVLCLLDDRNGTQELKYLRQLRFPTQSAAVDSQCQRMWFSKPDGSFGSEAIETLKSSADERPVNGSAVREENFVANSCPSSPLSPSSLSGSQSSARPDSWRQNRCSPALASICIPQRIVSIDSDRTIRIRWMCADVPSMDLEQTSGITLPAHRDALHGVVSLPRELALGDYATWSLEGSVHFWSLDGCLKRSEKVQLEQPEQSSIDYEEYDNELRVVRVSANGQSIVSGDRFGVLQVIQCQSWTATPARAHAAEISDIALSEAGDSLLVATGSRDRTVQLLQYKDAKIEVLQTLDDHVGAVTSVQFSHDFLLSASSDRTVIVRQRLSKADEHGTGLLAYTVKRVITLKASPTSITLPEPDVLLISTMDRQILTFNIATGVAVDGFKALDAEGEDAVVFNSLTVNTVRDASGSRRILAGFSSTDKSIRLYDLDRGVLLARELGHTEGISDVTFLDEIDQSTGQDKKVLVSTGLDGLIMVWHFWLAQPRLPATPLKELSQGPAMTIHDSDGTPIRDSILKRPPLRKVLSKLDLADVTSLDPPVLSSRDQSPPRVTKKTSRYSLAPPKLNGLSAVPSTLEILPVQQRAKDPSSPSPITAHSHSLHRGSPPPQGKTRKAEPATEDTRRRARDCSPSPPLAPPSLPGTPKTGNGANKGRLRRPPSIPSDLRGQWNAQARRKSVGMANEFGSIGMASEQVCRTLRAYRKKMKAAPKTEQLQLEEVEVELLATLRAIEERHRRNGSRRTKAATDSDLDNLARLMETSELGQWSELQPKSG